MGAAVFVSALLSACGGGGGGGGGTPPVQPTPTHGPTPTPSPTSNPFGCAGQSPFASTQSRRPMIIHPIAAGDTFSYTGSLSKKYTQSAPCPQPTSTTSATIAVSVTDSATSSPAGAATDQKSVETDSFPTQATVITTDQVLQNTATQFLLYSTTSKDSISNTITTKYANPQVLDELPEVGGQTWGPNNPAGSVTETLADGTRVSRSIKSDGSYTDTETYVNGVTNKITIDGAANGKPLGGGVYTIAGTAFTYAPPSGGNITLTIAGSPVITRTFPAWFTVPASYISDTFVDNGVQPFDANCVVNASIGTSGNQLIETYSVLDPVLGYTETRKTTSYVVSGFGAVCVKIDDTLKSFYDYQNDTTRIDYQSQNGQPNSIDHIVEYLGMTTPSSAYPAVRTQSAKAVSATSISARISSIEHIRAVQRAHRMQALHRFAVRLLQNGRVR
jgi:hypothetical protein